MSQKFHPKSLLYDNVKMTKTITTILKSFVIVGSIDCDHTLIFFHNWIVNLIVSIYQFFWFFSLSPWLCNKSKFIVQAKGTIILEGGGRGFKTYN
jgi:hypothetical protein